MRKAIILAAAISAVAAPASAAAGRLSMGATRQSIAAFLVPDGARGYAIGPCRRYSPLTITCRVVEHFTPTAANEELIESEEGVSVYLHGRKVGVRGSLKELGL